MDKAQKTEQVDDIKNEWRDVQSIILAEYRGLDVPTVTAIRDEFRKVGCKYRVLKNTLVRIAIQGTKVEVPTLDGPVTLTIPSGTSSGAKLRIKGRGIERGGEKGDQYAVVKVVIPKDLDEDDLAAVQKMQSKHPLNPRADVRW